VQARFEIGRTHLSLATLTHLHGNLEAAMMHLTQAYNRFNALQVPTYIACTQQRLHELKRAFTMHQGKSP
jgi:hypothetical protein